MVLAALVCSPALVAQSIEGFAVAGGAAAAISAADDTPPAAQPPDDDPDRDPNISQPDFTIVNLPTTLRVPRFGSAFRVTHRFTRPLGQGTFGELAENLFGLDGGALIGLEYRFGLMRGFQIGVLRTSDRTIQLFGHYNIAQQTATFPIGLGALVSVDGTNNFRDRHSPAVGLVASREIGRHGAIYLQPTWVNNTRVPTDPVAAGNNTLLVGIGARIRFRPTGYLVGEILPRAGHTPGVTHATFGVERRAGGHVFQLNFSNGFGNTPGQLARGGTGARDWYIGFNISRKFF